MLIEFDRLRLQVGFGCFQTAPARVAKKPKPFLWQFPLRSAQSRLAQRRVKDFVRFARVAQHQETKTIELRQILFSIRHECVPEKSSGHSTRLAIIDKDLQAIRSGDG